jgi:NitT/TauT family transport system ATP-binding protein
MTTTTPPLLSLKNVGKSFPNPDGTSKVILRDITLDVHPGEFVTIVGPSGCGKSTLLFGVGGFHKFTTGDATFLGQPLGAPNRDRGIVFQDYTIPEYLTVEENTYFGIQLQSYWLLQHFLPLAAKALRKKHAARIEQLLGKVGLLERAKAYPRELSGGQKQRAAIAQVLATNPKIVLMDEPFSALDPATRESLQELILHIQRENRLTVLFVTHDLEEAVYLGDRIVVLSQFHGEELPGAKIILDKNLDDYDDPEIKSTPRFAELVRDIFRIGFEPKKAIRNAALGISHPQKK